MIESLAECYGICDEGLLYRLMKLMTMNGGCVVEWRFMAKRWIFDGKDWRLAWFSVFGRVYGEILTE